MSLDNYKDDRAKKAQLLMLAEQGNADAQYELGMLYKSGDINTPPNVIAAQRWLKKAALQKHDKASYEVKKLTVNVPYKNGENTNFMPSSAIKTSKAIPNDQLRGVTEFLKKSAKNSQTPKTLNKPNVHTPLSDICRQIQDNPQQNKLSDLQSLPPTLRHLYQKLEHQMLPNDNEHPLDTFNILRILPSEVLAKINSLIGLFEIKKDISKLSYKIHDACMSNKKHIQGFHTLLPNFLLCGNPGSGKSTVSYILKDIFCYFSLITDQAPIVIDTSILAKMQKNQIDQSIHQLFQEAQNKVLLINQLDQLCRISPNLSYMIFETLIHYNSQFTDNILIIANCQRHALPQLIEMHPKFEKLFQQIFQFYDLHPSELIELYQINLKKKNLTITAEALDYMNRLFQTLHRTRGHVFRNAHLVHSNLDQHIQALNNRIKKDKTAQHNLIIFSDVQL